MVAKPAQPIQTLEFQCHPTQLAFINSTAIFRAMVAGVGAGKALALDTPIPTPTGWTTMGEIKAGDVIFADDGKPCNVIAVGPVYQDRPCFEVVFSDQNEIVADAEHEWLTHTVAYRKSVSRSRKPPAPEIVTTKIISETLAVGNSRNHAIPVCAPLTLPEQELPVSPYTFGAWLGDGTSMHAHITVSDSEVLESIRNEGLEVSEMKCGRREGCSLYRIHHAGTQIGYREMPRSKEKELQWKQTIEEYESLCASTPATLMTRNRGGTVYQRNRGKLPSVTVAEFCRLKGLSDPLFRAWRNTLSGRTKESEGTVSKWLGEITQKPKEQLAEYLRKMGVLGKGNKHIPPIYLRASERQRWQLLKGLMDTDGCVNKSGTECEFTTIHKRLADDVCELCISLGIKTRVAEGNATLYGRFVSKKYRLLFACKQPVFTIQRKLDRQLLAANKKKRRIWHRYIKDVIPAPSVPVCCIQVDSPSHCYLAGRGMIPTHNSKIGAYDLIKRAKPKRLYLVLAPTYEMLSDTTFRSFVDVGEQLGFIDPRNVKRSAPPSIKLTTGAEVLFRSADQPERQRGKNLSGVWMDEASLMDEKIFPLVIARLREAGEQGWLSATFTPKGKSHWTYEIFATGRPDTELFHCRTKDNPFLPPTFYDVTKRQYTSFMAQQELEGSFIDPEGLMFKREWFRNIVQYPPDDMVKVRAWDKAATIEKSGDYSASTLLGRDRKTGLFYLCHAMRGKWSANDRNEKMLEVARMDGFETEIFIEQEPGSGGKESAEYSKKQLAGYNVITEKSTGSKEVRAQPLAAQMEAGNVILVNGHWLRELIDEFTCFPGGKNDDWVDCLSMCLNRLALVDHSWEFFGAEPRDSFLHQIPQDACLTSMPEEGWEGMTM